MLCARWTFLAATALVALGNPISSEAQQPSTASAPQFRPLTEADAQDNLAQLRTAAAALDQRFARAGESAEGWKTYLSWPTAQAELQKSKPDPAVLVDELEKLGAGYDGLELKPFADLRSALGNYLFVAVPDPNLPAGGKEHILALTQEEAAVGDRPTTEQTRKIADDVLWLDRFRQAPESVKNVRQRFDKPNFGVRIGKQVLDMGIGGPVDDVAPIQDVILGTYINGTGRTVGQTSAALGADAETAARFATFDAVMRGVNYSSSVGRNGPVCIYTTGQTCLSAAKRFWIDGAGLHDLPTVAVAQTCTTIDNIVSIKGRRIVENIAWRRAGKQKGEAEAIAGQHASARLDARIDAQAAPSVAQANERFQTKVKSPLEERRAYPQVLTFSTLPWAVAIDGQTMTDAGLAAQLLRRSLPARRTARGTRLRVAKRSSPFAFTSRQSTTRPRTCSPA